MSDEIGYIKFKCKWTSSAPIGQILLADILRWRERLYGLGLIGAYPGGIGYGNISVRAGGDQFIITGTATGNLTSLCADHFTKVVSVDLPNNTLVCEGPMKASSESMTHAAVYMAYHDASAVIHVHHLRLWEMLKGKVPTTDDSVSYGTPQMADQVIGLLRDPDTREKRIIVMGGHREGIITFGKSLDEAGEVLLGYHSLLDR